MPLAVLNVQLNLIFKCFVDDFYIYIHRTYWSMIALILFISSLGTGKMLATQLCLGVFFLKYFESV